jgi:hypothetical protein
MKQVRFANVVANVFEFEMFQPTLCSDDKSCRTTTAATREQKTKADRSTRCLHFTRAVEEEAKAEKATATVGDYDVDICNNDNDDHIIGNDHVHVNDDVDNNNIDIDDIDDIDDDGSINIDDRC